MASPQIAGRIPAELRDRFEAWCKKNKVSTSEGLRLAIEARIGAGQAAAADRKAAGLPAGKASPLHPGHKPEAAA